MALILVVDDEVLISEILAELLMDNGHEVVTAPHGRAALHMIRERKPAIVISDFMMPLMTGLELAQAIRADAEIAGLPVIMITGAQGDIARRQRQLFAAVIDKPYRFDDLLELVNSLISSR